MGPKRRRSKPLVTAALSDPREANPPRIRWVGRFIAGLLVIWVLLIGTWVAMYRSAGARLERQIASARQRGEPVMIAEFAAAPVEAGADAMPFLRKSDALYQQNPEDTDETSQELRTYPLTPSAIGHMRRYVELNAATLGELRSARAYPRAEWHPPTGANQGERERDALAFSTSNSTYRLSDLLVAAAVVARHRGDDAEAVEHVRDLLALARHVRGGSGLSEYDIELSTFGSATLAVRELVGQKLNDPRTTTRPATREQVTTVMNDLLDESDRLERVRRTFLGGRAQEIDSSHGRIYEWRLLENGQYGPSQLTWIQRLCQAATLPHYRLGTAEQVEDLTTVAGAAQNQADYPSASKLLTVRPWPRRSSQSALALWIERDRYTTWDRLLAMEFIHPTERRCSAVLLALRLYELDHDGQLPAQLSELVGRYLPAVPLDPMSASGGALRYARSGGTVMVYSVGTDGRDDIAAGTFLPKVEELGSWERGVPDYVLMLDPRSAATQPATTAPGPVTAPAPL